ncbi:UvrD-helicase domain-containing protein [bacterium]|nr:UvrD-helicase domain-containing protein [bacterium]
MYKNQIIESELSNFKTIVIDESQNIDNDILISIAHFCKSHKIKLFLLSDYKQNIYAWLNLEDLEDLEDNDKLLQKQKLLENSLKEIYEIDKKKRISYE